MCRKFSVLYIILFVVQFHIQGQPRSLSHLGVEDGLSNSYIVDFAQDGQGFVWIATESGLNRFDGKSFTTYTKNNSDIVSNELNTLLYDKSENTIWIGSQRDGVSIFDCNSHSFTNLTLKEGLTTDDVTHLSHAEDGGIWITHYHVGVEHYNKESRELTLYLDEEIEGMMSHNWCSFDDGRGNLYVGHAFDGLTKIDLEKNTARNIRHQPGNPKSLPGNTVRSIYRDSQKNIWVGTNNGLALFNPSTEEFITFRHDPNNPNSLGENYIYDIREMSDGTLWISTDMAGVSILDLRSIALLDPRMVTFKNMSVTGNHQGLSSSSVRSLFQDSFDNIWIGHYNRGIDFLGNKPPVFHVILDSADGHQDINEKQIWDICIDSEQQLWVGTENEIMLIRDDKIEKTINILPHLSRQSTNVHVNKILKDQNGMMWLATTNGDVFQFNPNNLNVKRIPFAGKGENVHEFYEDGSGKMWIGTENGLYSFNDGAITEEAEINNQLTDKAIFGVLRVKNGDLWIGTFGKGIFIFDSQDRLRANLEKEEGFVSNAINDLYMDKNDGVWAATRDGLVYFADIEDVNRYAIYDGRQGLENSFIRAISEDREGNIWVSTNAGISLWNGTVFNNYNHQDGTPIGGFSDGAASLRADGTLFFGSLNGVCYFNPAELTNVQRRVVPVQIVECLALNRQIENCNTEILIPSSRNKIELPYHTNSFQISFSSPDYSQNQQVEYAYIMIGLENSWYEISNPNHVIFRNLSPGDYTFKVKSRLKNQDWDEVNIATLAFRIYPPIWFTWYAKLIYLLTALLIVYFTIRYYKKNINLKASLELERKDSHNKQELNNERLSFYTNITHELRTPLTLILGPLEDLLQAPGMSPDHNKKINIIHASAIRLLNLINQILEFRKTETQNRDLVVSKNNLSNLIVEIGLRYKELCRNDKVTVNVDVDNKETFIYFDSEVITTILNNLLSNALKYTSEGEIHLSLRTVEEIDGRYTEIAVSDTGHGIEASSLSHIFEQYYQVNSKHQASGTGIGLALVKSLAELHEGILSVESELDKGTVFTLRLLTDNTYPSALHAEKKSAADLTDTNTNQEKDEDDDDMRPAALIVEDDDDIREYIALSLENDYVVLTAANGKVGLDMAREQVPDIIVSDIMMPEMDGIEFCRTVKEDIRTSHIPVILLTAKDTILAQKEGYESGADSYLMKPFSANLLKSRIWNLLESRRRLAEQISSYMQSVTKGTQDSGEKNLGISKMDEEFLNELTQIIESNKESDDLDNTFIQEKMNMSYSTFYRKVKGLTGLSPNKFIRKIKLKNSLQLLLTGSYKVSEVAYMSGFNDVVYFRKCFKDEYGMTPSEYLRSVT